MCGICGFVSKQNITREQLKIMNDTMINRGPDDSGEEIYPIRNGYQVGLAQRRPVSYTHLDVYKRQIQGIKVVGGRDRIMECADIYNIDEIIVAMPSISRKELLSLIHI